MKYLPVLALVAACFAAHSAPAEAAWEIGIQRGLATYSVSGDGGQLIIVCDPDRVYSPTASNANFVVTMPHDKTASQVVFLASDGHQAAFDVAEGIATQGEARPEDWLALIVMIRAGGRISVVTANDSFALAIESMPEFDCE